MNYPFKKIYITQKWGVNEETYKRFNYLGHNGLDLRLFDTNGNKSSTSLVYAPHDGVIKERRFDADGYGNYLKLESDIEGSILAHLKEFKVNINKIVKEGDLIGIADNTGWSTGSHLHWGYYKHPRDRQNGYGGTIDPTPYITEGDSDLEACLKLHKSLVDQLTAEKENHAETKTEVAGYKTISENRKRENREFIEKLAIKLVLPVASDESDILGSVERLIAVEDDLVKANKTITDNAKIYEEKEKEWLEKFDNMERDFKKLTRDFKELKRQRVELDSQDVGNEKVARTNRFIIFLRKLFNRSS